MNYQQKYLKYKEKYLNLKKQLGAGTELDKIKSNTQIPNLVKTSKAALDSPRASVSINTFNINIKRMYDNDKLLEELKTLTDEEKIELQTNSNIKALYKFISVALERNLINDTNKAPLSGLLELVKLVGDEIIIKRLCTDEDFMTLDNPNKECNNPTLVIGSCAEPSFFDNIHTINSDNEKIAEFLELIKINNTANEQVNIILGSRNIPVPVSGINITFDPFSSGGTKIDVYIKELKELKELEGNMVNKIFHLSNGFPLNTDESNKLVLDKILEMTKEFDIRLENKMCGSCHRSLYFLVNNAKDNFSYVVNPEQKLDLTDTEDIRKCFKK